MFKSKLSKVVLTVVLFVGISVTYTYYSLSKLSQSANEFFQLAGLGKHEEAKEFLSEVFISNSSESSVYQLFTYIEELGFQDATWASRSISGSTGTLIGTIKTKNGDMIPYEIGLI